MAKAKKLPSGNWRVQVFAGLDKDGKQIRKSFTAPTKKEAEFMAAEFKAKHKEIVRDKSAMTLSEGIDRYIEFKGGTLSPSTVRGYKMIQNKGLQSIMNIKMNKLTADLVQAAINEEVGVKKQKTIKNEYSLVKAVVKMYAPNLSLAGVTLPQAEKFEAQELTLQEVGILLNAIMKDEFSIGLLFAVCCGLRMSEITALKWENYDSPQETIHIKKAVVRDVDNHYVTKSTKSKKSTRKIVVPKLLSKLLNNSYGDPEQHIITCSQNCLREHLTKICSQNGLPHLRMHDLRHINASVMAYLDIPTKYALERGGWEDIATMDKIYQFTFQDEKKAVDDKINHFFAKLVEGS